MPPNDGTLIMRDARILFKNFAGREGMYNAEGDRNFCLILEEDLAADMDSDGWNVKRLKPRDDEEVGSPYVQVSVGLKNRPPTLVLITSKGRYDINENDFDTKRDYEDAVSLLDWVDIKKVDLIVRPYKWDVNGKTGIKAYLKSLFITVDEDPLELEYQDVPYANQIEGEKAPLLIEVGPQSPKADDSDVMDGEFLGETDG